MADTTNTDTTAASGAASLGPLNDRVVKDAIRGAYDLGYNDARNARTVPGDSAPGYIGRDVERDLGGALIHGLSRALAAPAADLESLRGKISRIGLDIDRALAGDVVEQSPVAGRLKQIAALARTAAPAAQEAEPAYSHADVSQAHAAGYKLGLAQVDALRHSANEWADMATNGLQWMRNVVDGTSDPKDALANLERNLAHCRAVNDAPSVQSAVRVAAAPQAPAAGAAPTDADWWRKRADVIEMVVARSGSTEAMRCFTDMRTLLQAATLGAAAPAQEADAKKGDAA